MDPEWQDQMKQNIKKGTESIKRGVSKGIDNTKEFSVILALA